MNDPVNQFLLRRLEATQTSWGRFWLKAHLTQQKLRAFWLTHGDAFLKRTFDILVSLTMLIVLSPFLALIGLAVWVEDGGPIFFAQTRVGQFGRLFKMYKIRSMCPDADARLKELLARNQQREGITFKLKDDPRMTR